MRRQIATALCLAVIGLIGSSSLAVARPQERRTYTPAKRAGGVTEKAYVILCRDRDAPTRTTAKPATPATPVAGAGNTTGNRPVYLPIKDLMQSIIDPSADVLWGAVGTVVDNEGTHELFPKTPEEWLESRHAAVRIIEGGNLLMMPGREVAPVGAKSDAPGAELEPAEIAVLIRKNRKSFEAFAGALQGIGLETLQAIDTKNTALLLEIGARMENVCEGCHQTFWYPQDKDLSTNAGKNRFRQSR